MKSSLQLNVADKKSNYLPADILHIAFTQPSALSLNATDVPLFFEQATLNKKISKAD
ncbi:hypothetical protein DSUL_40133 [Desulfovibrionales bacterium]